MLVTRALAADIDLLALHRLAPARYPLLLESTAAGTAQGRWDLLLATDGQSLTLDQRWPHPRLKTVASWARISSPRSTRAWRAQRVARDEPRWPFRGGWALFLAYELAAQVEPVLRPAARRRARCRWRWRCAVRLRCCAITPRGELRHRGRSRSMRHGSTRSRRDCQAARAGTAVAAVAATAHAGRRRRRTRFLDGVAARPRLPRGRAMSSR